MTGRVEIITRPERGAGEALERVNTKLPNSFALTDSC